MKTKTIPVLLYALGLLACSSPSPQKETPVVKEEPQSYTNATIGWTMAIPPGFKLISQAKVKDREEKGKKAIGEVYEGDLNTDSVQHLLDFQKNQLNLFGSTLEKYTEKHPGDYLKNSEQLKKLLYDTYAKQKIKIDTASATENIQGHQFHVFKIKIYGPSGAPLMNQVLYSTLIKGYDFGVSINYDNETDQKLIFDAFRQSKFEQ